MTEEWRQTHHPDYAVSNLGRVKSIARGRTARILKPGRGSHGYPTVSFGRVLGSQCVHRLVAAAFIGPCPIGQECRHKDDDRMNARADNLEYGTRAQNILDAVARGRWNRPSKVTAEEVEDILAQVIMGVPRRVIGWQYRVCRQTIDKLVRKANIV